jgi:adhesin/invasin
MRLGSWRTRLALAVLAAVACVEPTGPGSARLGQVRLRAVFATGESEAELRVAVDSVRVRITREGVSTPLVDTTTAYQRDDAMGWVLDLAAAQEELPVLVELRGGGTVLYVADSAVLAEEGRIGEAEVHDVFVSYVGPARTMSVAITPTGATLDELGGTAAMAAVARDRTGAVIAGAVFAWGSSAPEVATVDAAGLVTAVAEGSTQISASHDGISTSVTVTIDVADGVPTTVHSTIDAAPTGIPADNATAATITVRLFDGLGHALTTSGGMVTLASDVGALSAVTDHGDGTYTASIRSSLPGAATISGALDGEAIVDVATVDFTPWVAPSVVTTIVVGPADVTLTALGATQPYTAVARDQFGAVMDGVAFEWTSSHPGVAAIDAVSGLATAASAGSTTIGASAAGITGTTALTVIFANVPSPVHSTIEAAPANVPADGASESIITVRLFNGLGDPLTTSGGAVTLTSDLGVLSAVTDHGDGTYAASLRSTTPGIATITGTLNGAPIADDATVEFTPFVPPTPVLTSIEVTPADGTLSAFGATTRFTAIARDQFGAAMDGVVFTWSSSDETTATVDAASGVATALANGITAVRAMAAGVGGEATLTVAQRAATIELSVPCPPGGFWTDGSTRTSCDALTALGAQLHVTAVTRDANGNLVESPTITWASSDPAVLTVDGNGLVTAVGNGPSLVTATADGVQGEIAILVRQVVTRIVVTPATLTLAVGEQHQLVAVAYDANDMPVLDAVLTWNSREPMVVATDATGRVTALSAGQAMVKAFVGAVFGFATITVP